MEEMLKTILEEVKGTKQEFLSEMQDMKKEMQEEMQDMKKEMQEEMQKMKKELKEEILEEVDNKIEQQTIEIAQELRAVEIFLEKRDNQLKEGLEESLEIQKQILEEIRQLKITDNEHEYRIRKLELAQESLCKTY